MIQRFHHRTTVVMSQNVSDPLGLPPDDQHSIVLKLLEHDLNALEGQIWGNLSRKSHGASALALQRLVANKCVAIDQLYFQCTRLYLAAFHWLCRSPAEERRLGILRSYAVSVTFINDLLAADVSFNVLSYCPTSLWRMLFNASYIILKVLNSSFSQYVDCSAGAVLFHATVAALRKCSIEEDDMSIRASKILADVWNHRDEVLGDKSTEPVLVTRSRIGTNILIDCLWRWKEYWARVEATTGKSINVSACRLFPHFLPFESLLMVKGPVPKGKEPVDGGIENSGQVYDPNVLGFTWDIFDDLSWSWNFDIPPIAVA
jgi:hypothetical protein